LNPFGLSQLLLGPYLPLSTEILSQVTQMYSYPTVKPQSSSPFQYSSPVVQSSD